MHLPELLIWQGINTIVRALVAIHEKGFIHRDIKPKNIFLKADSCVLGDFGYCGPPNTVGAGTSYYMAPEQLNETSDSTEKTDIWSLGATLYEIMTLRKFHGSPRTMLKLTNLVNDGPIYSRIPKVYSSRLIDVTKWLMQKKPEDRPTAAELQAYLDDLDE
jgi:serine/threonine-protein kinase